MQIGRFKLATPLDPVWDKIPGRPSATIGAGILFIVLATLMAYSPVFTAGFIWDDDDYVINNLHLNDWDGLREMWFHPAATPQYYPLVFTTFWLEHHLWGLHAGGYHMVNVLLHILAALLLWRVLARLRVPGAWLAAAIFALHPVEVESVAWITERKNVLSAVFYLAAALAWLRFAELEPAVPPTRRRWGWYAVALVLFVAALLSKTVTCSLPAVLLLVMWWKKGRLDWRAVLPLAPFFLAGIGLGLTTAWLEKTHVGAIGADWSLTLADRCLVAGRALWFYASNLVFPTHLMFIYPRWTIDAGVWWQWLFPVAVAGVLAALWRARHRIGRGPLVAVLIYAGTLAPAIGFINVYPMRFSFVADHFQYLAGAGLIALAATWLHRCPPLIPALGLFLCGALTWHQCAIYQDLETLWRDTLKKNPACWMAHSNLGRLLVRQNKLAEAEAHYRAGLELNPREEEIHYNYANLLARTGRLETAVAEYEQALQLAPAQADPHNNLGAVLLQLKRTDEAIAQYRLAVQCQPEVMRYHYNLGSALAAEHQVAAAVAEFQRALQLEPDSDLIKRRLRALGVTANQPPVKSTLP
jgi:Flp pilus assembly protein TadD